LLNGCISFVMYSLSSSHRNISHLVVSCCIPISQCREITAGCCPRLMHLHLWGTFLGGTKRMIILASFCSLQHTWHNFEWKVCFDFSTPAHKVNSFIGQFLKLQCITYCRQSVTKAAVLNINTWQMIVLIYFKSVYMKVDCSDNGREVCRRSGVKGYPTLKVFKLGQFDADYVGPRHAGTDNDNLITCAAILVSICWKQKIHLAVRACEIWLVR